MKIRTILTLLFSLCLIVSCKNEGNKNNSLEIQEKHDSNSLTGDVDRQSSYSKSSFESNGENDSPDVLGTNDKIMDKVSSTIQELCLKEETIFISTRMSREDEEVVNIFLIEPAARNTGSEDIPGEDFDKNVAIATVFTFKYREE